MFTTKKPLDYLTPQARSLCQERLQRGAYVDLKYAHDVIALACVHAGHRRVAVGDLSWALRQAELPAYQDVYQRPAR